MSLEEQPLSDDQIFRLYELDLLIHHQDMVYFEHTKLDYVIDTLGLGRFQLLKV